MAVQPIWTTEYSYLEPKTNLGGCKYLFGFFGFMPSSIERGCSIHWPTHARPFAHRSTMRPFIRRSTLAIVLICVLVAPRCVLAKPRPRVPEKLDDVVDDEYFNDLPTPPSDSRHRRGDHREGSKLIPGASAADADHSEERQPALPDEISVAAPVQTSEDGVRVHDAGSPALAPAPGPEAEPEATSPDEAGEATPGRAVQMF